jgi:probable F420-dependent oxidoreductase
VSTGRRPFRFGFQTSSTTTEDLRREAVAAEAAGFDVFCTFDHVGVHWSAFAPLVLIAAVTERLRLCPLVINNDFHHPVHLAQEAATVDHLSQGRVEIGIGAGHAFTEYAQFGQSFDAPAIRKARLRESVEVLRALLDGEEVTFHGLHYQLTGARTLRSLQPHLPIFVGVNGRDALTHAARHADTIGLMMLGRTLEDGLRHEVRWQQDRLDATVAFINDQAAGRERPLELNALVQRVVITTDRAAVAGELATQVEGLEVDDALTTPFLALGDHDEIAEHLLACRERWGISYYVVRDIDAFAPVIERLSGH